MHKVKIQILAEEQEDARNQETHLLLGLLCISTSSCTLDPNMAAASALPPSTRANLAPNCSEAGQGIRGGAQRFRFQITTMANSRHSI